MVNQTFSCLTSLFSTFAMCSFLNESVEESLMYTTKMKENALLTGRLAF